MHVYLKLRLSCQHLFGFVLGGFLVSVAFKDTQTSVIEFLTDGKDSGKTAAVRILSACFFFCIAPVHQPALQNQMSECP